MMEQSYLCMVFALFSGCLVRSLRTKEYGCFGENGMIDSCLEERNVPVNVDGYFGQKRKF